VLSKTHSFLSLKKSNFTEANRDCSSILFSSLKQGYIPAGERLDFRRMEQREWRQKEGK
jgi:hypothetical protein